jgi:hypothetical protein
LDVSGELGQAQSAAYGTNGFVNTLNGAQGLSPTAGTDLYNDLVSYDKSPTSANSTALVMDLQKDLYTSRQNGSADGAAAKALESLFGFLKGSGGGDATDGGADTPGAGSL